MGNICSGNLKTIDQPPKLYNTRISKLTARFHELDEEETTTSFVDIRKVYKFDSKAIGNGHFGTVRIATLITNPGKKFAVKTISKEKIKKEIHLLIRELKILRTLDHPNIVKFYETYQDERFFHLVMEYCTGGELLDRIIETGYLPEREAALILKKIFSAVLYLHDRGICHRDLKPENFLFSSKKKDAEIKIIDFGLSKQFVSLNDQYYDYSKSLKTVVGTPLYVAPEVLKGKYDYRCDNWSLGVIIYILLSGNPPFYGETNQEIFKKVISGKYNYSAIEWKKVSKSAKDLISKLLCVDVQQRYSAEKALSHSWFKTAIKFEDNKENSRLDPKILKLLQNFRSVGKFRKEALKVIVNFLSENEIKNLKEAFQSIDTDNSGMISFNELEIAMKYLGYKEPEEEILRIMNTMHLQPDDEINYTEFIAATLDKKFYLSKEKLWSAFRYFDIDNTGFITLSNLKEAMARAGRKINESELEEWIREIDSSKDGKISYDEFFEMMKSEKVETMKSLNDF